MKSLSQIAKELGVSHATVSYVYNNKWRENRIREDVVKKIQEKLKKDRAAPDMRGSQLRSGKTNTIGVLMRDFDRYYNLQLLGGIETTLQPTDYLVLLGNSKHKGNDLLFLEKMINRKVDGIIFCPTQMSNAQAYLKLIKEANIPFVFIDNYLKDCVIPYVVSDNNWGTEQAVTYCINQGKKRIAYLGGNPEFTVLADRYAGYCNAVKKAGMKLNKDLVNFKGLNDPGFISQQKPDAVFIDSLLYLNNSSHLLNELNKNMMIVGFDEPQLSFSRAFQGPVHYIQQNAKEMGKQATDVLLKMIKTNKKTGKNILVKPTMSWNHTTKG